jgi:two-component sensor histidine kinase
MIFKPPVTNFDDFYENAKFMLTWRVAVTFSIFLPILGTAMYFLEDGTTYSTFFAVFVCAIVLLSIYITKHYKIAAFMFAIIGTILCLVTLIMFPKHYHFVDTMWVFIIVLYTFFSLGKVWGTAVLFTNTLGIIYYLMFVLKQNLEVMEPLRNEHYIILSVNFAISAVLNGYLIRQFIITTKYAENTYVNLNKALKANNDEKTILLKEIHHRVKNNLQVITSLLRLQSREITDEKSKEIYKESINRVVAMALIHEKMYQTKDLAHINLENYVIELSEDLKRSYSINQPLNIEINSEIEKVTTKSLVPLALIFNELISNSLKHAFIDIENANIKIDITLANNTIKIDYSDNGKWRTQQKSTSFGIELIEALTEQLSGTYTFTNKYGVNYIFNFPNNL